jgi:hypothetical protein
MSDREKLAAEALAVADSLRSVRGQLARLVHETDVLLGLPETTRTVLVEGLTVALALEALAGHVEQRRKVSR